MRFRICPSTLLGMLSLSKHLLLVSCVLFLAARSVSAWDTVTNLVGNAVATEKISAQTYLSGDLWLKQHQLDKIKVDLDLYFEKTTAKVNVAQAKLMLPATDVIVGRQQIGWGVATMLNPLDIFNPAPAASSLDPSFVRSGRDSLIVRRYFGSFQSLEFIYALPYYEAAKSFAPDFGAKFKTRLEDYALAISYINRGERHFSGVTDSKGGILGLELTGTTFYDWGFWTEYARYLDRDLTEAIVGTDYYWSDYHFVLEYYRNGFGAKNSANYDLNLLLRGKALARDYLIPLLSYTVDEKLALTGFGLWNMNDGSAAGGGTIDYFVNDNVELIILPIVMFGGSSTEYGIQKATYGRYAVTGKLKWVF